MRRLSLLLAVLLTLSGCAENFVHKKSVAQLNEKAQQLMQQGDMAGAVARLEAARELDPSEPATLQNLAIAYQAAGQHEKALTAFNELLEQPSVDKAQIQKSIGIVHEAMGDEFSAKASEATDQNKPTEAAPLTEKAKQHYEEAIAHYREALPGLQSGQDVQMQIDALTQKLAKLESGTGGPQ